MYRVLTHNCKIHQQIMSKLILCTLLNLVLFLSLNLNLFNLLYILQINILRILHIHSFVLAGHLLDKHDHHRRSFAEEIPHPLPVGLYPHIVKDGSEAGVEDQVEDQVDSFPLSANRRQQDERLRQPDQKVEPDAHRISPPPRLHGLGIESKVLSIAATEMEDENIEEGTDEDVAKEASKGEKFEWV